ncbi:sulfurtransferase complex subunit TusC [Oceaniserpentilla sp. 4NH20-0058]|uniref:sulfurtransferase complex subunit TusC n=1 Tax=Oceaniserpentilla sp. 4NH20-0058 TaxID=3127660 RepID=UPI003107F132
MDTSTHIHDILIIQRHAPYGSSLAREGIDFALTSAAYEQNISILFSGDGVFQLLENQNSKNIHLKNHKGALEVLPLYDIEQLYAVKEDMEARNINAGDILSIASIITRKESKQLIHRHEKILGF